MGQVFAEVLFCHVNITIAPCGFLPSVICSVTGNQGALWQRRQLESCKGAEWTVVAFKPLLVALPGHTGTRVLAEVHFSTCSLLMSFKGRRARPAPAVIFFFFFFLPQNTRQINRRTANHANWKYERWYQRPQTIHAKQIFIPEL